MGVGGVSSAPRGGLPEKEELKKRVHGKEQIRAMVSQVVVSVREAKPSTSISAPRVQANMSNPALPSQIIHIAIVSTRADSIRSAKETANWVVASLPSMNKRELVETIVQELKTLSPDQQRAFWYNMAAFVLHRTA